MPEPSWSERPWERPADDAGAVNAGKPKSRFGCLWLTVVTLVSMVGCSIVVSNMGGGESSSPSGIEARMQCQEWVKAKLKAPSTAKFSGQVVSGGPASWTATGEVDAENSFGGTVRSSWTCEIRLDGDQWTGNTGSSSRTVRQRKWAPPSTQPGGVALSCVVSRPGMPSTSLDVGPSGRRLATRGRRESDRTAHAPIREPHARRAPAHDVVSRCTSTSPAAAAPNAHAHTARTLRFGHRSPRHPWSPRARWRGLCRARTDECRRST